MRNEIELTTTSGFDPSRRRFLGLLGGGLAGVILTGFGLILYNRKLNEGKIILSNDLQSGIVDGHNIVILPLDRIQSFLDSTNTTEERMFALPFPFDPSETDSKIEFVREYIETSIISPKDIPNNYIRFTGLRTGSVFKAPFTGELAWGEASHGPLGIFLQQRTVEGNYVNLSLGPKEEIEFFVDLLPTPQNSPIFFSETKTNILNVSLGQPLFRTLTEKNINGPDYQIDILGQLFTPTAYQDGTSIPIMGRYDPLDIRFLLTGANKYIITK